MDETKEFVTLDLDEQIYIQGISPVDFWGDCKLATDKETHIILALMPEESRDDRVYKTFLPNDYYLMPVYMCKADNNGTVYVFSNKYLAFLDKGYCNTTISGTFSELTSERKYNEDECLPFN